MVLRPLDDITPHDRCEPQKVEYHCTCPCSDFWIEEEGQQRATCPKCSGMNFVRVEYRRPLKQY